MVLKCRCFFRMSFEHHAELIAGQQRLVRFAGLMCCSNVTGNKCKLMGTLPISVKRVVFFLFWYCSNILQVWIWWGWLSFYSLVLHQHHQLGFIGLSPDLCYWNTEYSFLMQNRFHMLIFTFMLLLFIPCGILSFSVIVKFLLLLSLHIYLSIGASFVQRHWENS